MSPEVFEQGKITFIELVQNPDTLDYISNAMWVITGMLGVVGITSAISEARRERSKIAQNQKAQELNDLYLESYLTKSHHDIYS